MSRAEGPSVARAGRIRAKNISQQQNPLRPPTKQPPTHATEEHPTQHQQTTNQHLIQPESFRRRHSAVPESA